mmetsp:Transcript_6290/g.16407  ORF Transcript_6290/g.16407 Transcript_6290/m.16407 type:complete len:248 (+) Transcript_6290:856-1599(+)
MSAVHYFTTVVFRKHGARPRHRRCVHHLSVVGRGGRIVPVEVVQNGLERVHELGDDGTLHDYKVRRDARLAEVDRLPPRNAAGGDSDVCTFSDDTGRFAAKLEHRWRERVGCLARNDLADAQRACEEDKPPPPANQLGRHRRAPLDDHDALTVGGQKACEQRGGGGALLRGLEHYTVAPAQSADHRRERQLQGIVERRHDEADTEGLAPHIRGSWQHEGGRRHALIRHERAQLARHGLRFAARHDDL